MNKKYLFLFLCTIFFISQALAQDQELTEEDKKAIKFRSETFIKEFESLLILISDPSLEPYKRKEIMVNSFSQNANQLFLNGDVIIEDDIDPDYTNNSKKQKNVKIERYLNDLDLFYEKSIEPTISFSNIITSEVSKGDYVFLAVYFESEFRGKNIAINHPYTKNTRVATIKAEKKNGLWYPLIVSIVFYNPTLHPMFNEALNVPEIIPEIIVKDSVVMAVAESSDMGEDVAEVPTVAPTLIFNPLPSSLKKGKRYPITWTKTNLEEDIDLELYKNGTREGIIGNDLSGNSYDWTIPEHIDLKATYQLKLTSKGEANKSAWSDDFKISRKIPLGLKVLGGGLVAGGIIFLITNGGDSGGDPTPGTNTGGEKLIEPTALPGG
ncbi:Ser-Thr-rich GPI-anchored membrane family protein [Flexithrix dorotheae]|uniref:Ser-Thr-rich GPI-anchored membrane family protein n=1 Tax=Flexithrix dorotheae TaxID=70993 RepID=UPI000363BE26|nr:Ser-Thr-rich GPI-anchored membrane family protein [Flexithrix dorotheae]